MSLTKEIFNKLNEAAEVKKPYGDKPQEGKNEKLTKGKGASIPKGKADNKIKGEPLKNDNKEAAPIYTSDTEKLADKIDDTNHSDKGKVAKASGKRAERAIKYPFGDKPQASDSKLVKEGAEVKECDGKDCDNKLNESWMSIQTEVTNAIEKAMHDESLTDEDRAAEFLQGIVGFIYDFAEEHGLYLEPYTKFESADPELKEEKCYGCGKEIKKNGVEIGGHMYHPSCGAFLDECGSKKEAK